MSPHHQFGDLYIVRMRDFEDLAVAEDVVAMGGGGKLDGGMAAWVVRIKTIKQFAETVGVRCLDEEVVIAVDHAVQDGAERVGHM